MINSVINTLSNFGGIINGFLTNSLNNTQIIDLSITIIIISIIIIIFSGLILIFFLRKTREEKIAEKIVFEMNLIKKGKKFLLKEDKKNYIKDGELNLKQLLTKKFKPLIEKQLKSQVIIEDFNAKENNFVTKINVQGNKLELILDSSGKIIDYKRL
ncbi:MAG: hypothetical protein PHP82_04350 [Candidatus ainarchaeum sp.]|nr:hypothetical protein [Candidatus ainarchaeum sp.]